MPTSAHYKAVQAFLSGNGNVTYDVYAGGLRDGSGVSDAIAATRPAGGTIAYRLDGGAETQNEPIVQILVRGSPDDFDGAHAEAQAIHAELKDADISGYQAAWAEEPGPLTVGRDDDGRPIFSMNVRLLIDE